MKHTTFFYLVATAFVLVGATACSSGDDGDEPANPTPTNPTERKLVIGVKANPWLDENGNARETRGAVITTETLQQFFMDAYNSSGLLANYTVNRNNDNSWIPTPDNNQGGWPGDKNTPVSFYAHTADNCYKDDSGNYYVAFTVEEASANQSDLLLSRVTNVTYSGTGGVIWFTFDHACAAVEFNIQITNKLKTEKNIESLTVNSVALKNIANTGDCYYSTGSGNQWKNVGDISEPGDQKGYTNYTLNTGALTVTTSPKPLPCNTLFVIPQKLGTDTKLVINYTLSDKENTAEIPLKETDKDTEWKAGHLYPINIVLGTTLIQ